MSIGKIIIKRRAASGMSLEELFRRGQVVEVESLPFCFTIENLDDEGASSAVRLDACSDPRDVAVTVDNHDVLMSLNGTRVLNGKIERLHNGDVVMFGESEISFFFSWKRPPISFSAHLLGRFAKIAVYVLCLCELLALMVFPVFLKNTKMLDNECRRTELLHQLELCRRRVSKLHSNDLIMEAYFNALASELNGRGRYMNRYINRLSDEQLFMQADNLLRLYDLVEQLENAENISTEFVYDPVDLDTPVRNILNGT